MKPIRTLLLPSLSLASTALGQVVAAPTDDTTTRGALSAMPLAVSLFHAVPATGTGTGTDPLLFKDTGDQSIAPAMKTGNPASNLTPDYRLGKMFPNTSQADLWKIDIDAFSSGNDELYYDATGLFLGDALGGWATLVFTVDHNATGTGGPISDRRLSGANVGADVYSYAADNSLGIDDGIIGVPMLEIPHEVVSLPLGTDLQAIDLFLPMIAANGGIGEALIQNTAEFYFSLSSSSATRLAPLWNMPIDGATILKITWTPGTSTTPGLWSAPVIVRSSSDMGLTAADDIDALAVATNNIPITFSGIPMIVSTVPTAAQPNRNQILALVGQNTPTPTLVPLHGSSGGGGGGGGGPITGGIKLNGTDNITGLAGMDPDYGNYSKRFGQPIEPSRPIAPSPYPDPVTSLTRPGTRPLGLSAVASMVPGGNAFVNNLTVQVTGWGIPGVANQAAGTIYFALSPTPTNQTNQLHFLTMVPRAANQHTVQVRIPFPAGITGDMGLIALFIPNNGSPMTWSPISMMSF